jgi:hypothetical protein
VLCNALAERLTVPSCLLCTESVTGIWETFSLTCWAVTDAQNTIAVAYSAAIVGTGLAQQGQLLYRCCRDPLLQPGTAPVSGSMCTHIFCYSCLDTCHHCCCLNACTLPLLPVMYCGYALCCFLP